MQNMGSVMPPKVGMDGCTHCNGAQLYARHEVRERSWMREEGGRTHAGAHKTSAHVQVLKSYEKLYELGSGIMSVAEHERMGASQIRKEEHSHTYHSRAPAHNK